MDQLKLGDDMASYIVRSERLAGFPAGTVLEDTDLPQGTNVAALVTGGHLESYDSEGAE